MTWFGDISLEDTIDIKFTTRNFSTGAPFTLAGTPVISAYPGNSTTQLTAGITLTVDFDAVTGLHNVRVVATAANGYAAATNYALVITTGTVNSVSVVGEVVGSFSISARSALRPTVVGRTLDVSAGGEAGIDWANVGTPSTSVSLSATTVATVSTLTGHTAQTGDNFARLGAPAGASVSADIAAVKTDTAAILVDTGTTLDGNITSIKTTTDKFVFTVANQVNANMLSISGDGVAADNLEAALDGTGGVAITATFTGNVTGSIGSLAAQAKADVNAEVVDALATDTYAEPGQGAPAATATLAAKINYLFKAWRNKSDQTATLYQLYADDATTVDQKATVSDDAVTFVKGEVAAGP